MINGRQIVPQMKFTPQVFFGKRAITMLKNLDYSKYLFLYSKSLVSSENFKKIKSYFIDNTIYYELILNNKIEYLSEIANKYKINDIECIIAIGGGKVLDSAKIIKYLISGGIIEKGNLVSHIKNPVKLVACPTTPSSGSESNSVAVILKENKKYPIVNNLLIPNLAILDPSFLSTLSKNQIIFFAMDILSHAVESYTSKSSNEYSRFISIKVIDLLIECFEEIIKGYYQGQISTKFLEKFLLAGHLGGLVAGNAFVGVIHALAHAHEDMFQISHSQSIGEFIKRCIIWQNRRTHLDIYDKALHIIRIANLDSIINPSRWKKQIDNLIILTLNDVSMKTNKIRIKKEELEAMLS